MSAPNFVTVTPSPVRRGASIEICYDFTSSGTSSATLDVDFDPDSGSLSLVLLPFSPCATIAVPDDAVGMLIDEPNGPSAAWGAPVYPPA